MVDQIAYQITETMKINRAKFQPQANPGLGWGAAAGGGNPDDQQNEGHLSAH